VMPCHVRWLTVPSGAGCQGTGLMSRSSLGNWLPVSLGASCLGTALISGNSPGESAHSPTRSELSRDRSHVNGPERTKWSQDGTDDLQLP
jgi:hypothetical protein